MLIGSQWHALVSLRELSLPTVECVSHSSIIYGYLMLVLFAEKSGSALDAAVECILSISYQLNRYEVVHLLCSRFDGGGVGLKDYDNSNKLNWVQEQQNNIQ